MPSSSPYTGLSELFMSRVTRRCLVIGKARLTYAALSRSSPLTFCPVAKTSVSKRLRVLVLVACFFRARRPTMTCIAGPLASLAARCWCPRSLLGNSALPANNIGTRGQSRCAFC